MTGKICMSYFEHINHIYYFCILEDSILRAICAFIRMFTS